MVPGREWGKAARRRARTRQPQVVVGVPGRVLYTSVKETPMSVGAIETQPAPDAQSAAHDDAPEALVLLSDKAAEKVREIRTEENIEDNYALRLKVQGGGCSGFSYDLYFDQPQETDRAFDVKGVKLIC